MPRTRVNGIDMYYEVHGAGEPLLMIAGLGGDARGYAPVLPALAERYKVVLFDNRGAGQTEKPEEPYSVPMFAADTVGLLDALDIDRAHIIGGSMGGIIAQEVAINYPDRVKSLVLISTTARVDNLMRAITESWRIAAENLDRKLLAKFMLPWGFSPEFYENHAAELEMAEAMLVENPQPLYAFLNQLNATMNYDATDRLSRISAPTLVMVAREDILTPLRFAHVLCGAIPRAKLVVLPRGGHGAFIAEAPAEGVAAILEFLGSL